MTLANFWKLAIVSCDSFILILILFMLSLCCGIHENRGKREEEGGGGGRFKKYEFCKKNNYCKGCKKQRIFRFMLSFIMSSWDLLFSRITSSHVSLKNRGARCTRGLGWYKNKQTMIPGVYIGRFFQTIPWWHDKKDKMWSKIAFMLSSRHKSLFLEKQLLWRI